MRIVGIGGGTGLPVLLTGLKELSEEGQPLDITAIVTVADSGGSTGILRDAFGMPAMGDIRKCAISLAPSSSVLTSICRHRFENPDGFAGHSLGNLILSALYQMSGSFTWAVQQACDLLRLKGCVLPATEQPVTLCAVYDDGGVVRGESSIPQLGRRIQRVWLESAAVVGAVYDRPQSAGSNSWAVTDRPYSPPAAPGVIQAIERADAVVLGPGSLYTSIIPNLLVADIAAAIQTSRAIKIYVSNLMTQPGETDGYSAADHVRVVREYLPSIDLCILNSSGIGIGVAQRYLKFGSEIVADTPEDEEEIRRSGVVLVAGSFLKEGEVKARHDPATLARLVVSAACGFIPAAEVACDQRNGR